MSTPAGWYPDPSNAAQQRWWDGAQWTEHTHPAAQTYDPGVATADPAAGYQAGAQDSGAAYDPAAYGQAAQDPNAQAAYDPNVYGQAGYDPNAYGQATGPFDPGIGGIRTDLLSDERYGEVGSGERVVCQNSRLLKVVLGDDVMARQGSMVAFQGAVDFDHEGAGASRFLKKALTGEGLSLMRCTGRGELFLADGGKQVHIVHLDNAGISVNGRAILAFEPSLQWDIERVQGAGMAGGGLFNTRLHGYGWVAITTRGDPVVLRTDQPTFVDTDAVVAWSAGLQTSLNKTMKAKALIGKGSGEAVQLTFQGQGIVIVQPAEGDGVPPHSH
jgi:uncharacterized protein (AIM24 family)